MGECHFSRRYCIKLSTFLPVLLFKRTGDMELGYLTVEFGKLSCLYCGKYEGWNFNSGNYLFTTDTK